MQQAESAHFDLLIHFTGRPAGTSLTPFVDDAVAAMSPEQRLDSILWGQMLHGFAPFGAAEDQRMICLSESPPDHLHWLIKTRAWPPWGLIFPRQTVYNLGGGPVWHARQEQYGMLRPDQIRWATRFDTTPGNRSDWLHEREWRIPLPQGAPGLLLPVGSITTIVVGTPGWAPSQRLTQRETGYYIDQSDGQYCDPSDVFARPEIREVMSLPPLWESAHKLYWDPTAQAFLPTETGQAG
ncbi:hypothetical protein [Crossiella sp. S99.2]|uniref:hypothetical protein n=1 Tax=Crossiella sp. S99.2 TaxID=2936272 RepID=UPI001FFEB798|nr:hypothetical protein [Crossiella sp. S99.2]